MGTTELASHASRLKDIDDALVDQSLDSQPEAWASSTHDGLSRAGTAEILALDRAPPPAWRRGLTMDSPGYDSGQIMDLIQAEREAREDLQRTIEADRSARSEMEERDQHARTQNEERFRAKLSRELLDRSMAQQEASETTLSSLAGKAEALAQSAEQCAAEALEKVSFLEQDADCNGAEAIPRQHKSASATRELQNIVADLTEKLLQLEEKVEQRDSTAVVGSAVDSKRMAAQESLHKRIQAELDDVRSDLRGDLGALKRNSAQGMKVTAETQAQMLDRLALLERKLEEQVDVNESLRRQQSSQQKADRQSQRWKRASPSSPDLDTTRFGSDCMSAMSDVSYA